MLRKFTKQWGQEALAEIIGPTNTGRLFATAEKGVIYRVTAMNGSPVFLTLNPDSDQIWLIYQHETGPAMNERQAEIAAEARFVQERLELYGPAKPEPETFHAGPSKPAGVFVDGDSEDSDAVLPAPWYQGLEKRELVALKRFLDDPDLI